MDIHLECEVCFEVYDASDRKPMILDCGHTLCQQCLKLIHGTSRECPIDRKNISKELKEISPNYTLMQLLEVSASKPQKSPRNQSENTHNRGGRKEYRRSSRGRRPGGHHSIPRDFNPDPRPLASNPSQASIPEEVKIPRESKKKEAYKKRNVVFKNLPKRYDENQLLNMCLQFGRIESHHFVKNRDRPNENIGLAYVLFENEGDAIEAILNMNGIEIEGKNITVEMWREYDKKEKFDQRVRDSQRSIQEDSNPQREQSPSSNFDRFSSIGGRHVSKGKTHHSRGINLLSRQTQHKRGNIRQMINTQPEYAELLDFGENPIQPAQQFQRAAESNFEERPSQPAQEYQSNNPQQFLASQVPIVPQGQSIPHFQPSSNQVIISQISTQRQVISTQPPQNPPQRPIIPSQTSHILPQRPDIVSQSPQNHPQILNQPHQIPPQRPIIPSQTSQILPQRPDIVSQLSQILPPKSDIISQAQYTPNLYNTIPPYMSSPNPPAPNTKPQAPQVRNLPAAPTNIQSLDMQFQSLSLNNPTMRPQHQQDLTIRNYYESNTYIPPSTFYTHQNGTNLASYSRPSTSENPRSSVYPYQLANTSGPVRNEYTGMEGISRPAVISNPYEARNKVITNPYEPGNAGSSYSRANPYDRSNPNPYLRNPYEDQSASNREYQINNPYLNKK